MAWSVNGLLTHVSLATNVLKGMQTTHVKVTYMYPFRNFCECSEQHFVSIQIQISRAHWQIDRLACLFSILFCGPSACSMCPTSLRPWMRPWQNWFWNYNRGKKTNTDWMYLYFCLKKYVTGLLQYVIGHSFPAIERFWVAKLCKTKFSCVSRFSKGGQGLYQIIISI